VCASRLVDGIASRLSDGHREGAGGRAAWCPSRRRCRCAGV